MPLAAIAIFGPGVRAQAGDWRSPSVEYSSEALHAARHIDGLAAGPGGTLFAATDIGLLVFDGFRWAAPDADGRGAGESAFAVGVTGAGLAIVSGPDGVSWHRVDGSSDPPARVLTGGAPFRAACEVGGRVYLTRAQELVAVEDDGRGGARLCGRWRPDGITLPARLEFVKPIASGGQLFALLADATDPQRTLLACLIEEQLFQVVPVGLHWMVDAASARAGQIVVCTAQSGCVELGLSDDGRWEEVGSFGGGTACSRIIAMPGRGYLCFDSEGVVTAVGLDGTPSERFGWHGVTAAQLDRCGRIWLGAGGRLQRIHANDGIRVARVEHQAEVFGVCESADGSVWIATEQGINCLQPRRVSDMLPLMPRLGPGERSRACLAAASGAMVFSSSRSTRVLDVSSGRFAQPVGWPSDAAAVREGVLALASGAKLRVLFETESGWEDGRDVVMPAPIRKLGLSETEVWVSMAETGAGPSLRGIDLASGKHRDVDFEVRQLIPALGGMVALGHGGRLVELSVDSGARPLFGGRRDELHARSCAGTDEILWVIPVDDAEVALGFDRAGDELDRRFFPRGVTGRVVRELLPLAGGELLVVAANGLLIRSTLRPPTSILAPRLLRIERAASEAGGQTSWRPVSLSADQRLELELQPIAVRTQLRCSGVEFPESHELEARLKTATGYGPWLPVVDGWVELVNLREGAYVFEARARAPGGSTAVAEVLRVEIPPPWHRRWWFYALMAALVALIVWVGVRLRVAGERRRVALLEAEVRHRRSVEEQLASAHDTLRAAQGMAVQQERLQALGELAAGVAHDINNSLTPVLGYSEMLSVAGPMAESSRRECADLLWRSARDIAAVVDRLSNLYRPALDRPEEVEVQQILEETKALSRPKWCDEALRRGTEIEVRIDPSDLRLVCTPSRLRDALMNIVLNAVDAIRAPTGLIHIGARVVDRRVAIEVSDDGAGMDTETLARCLQPFYSTKGSQGTGLGLANCQAILSQHGGEVEVESAPGRGTKVRLLLPLRQTVSPPVASGGAEEGGRACAILVVDDDDRVRRAIRDQLEHLGHHVACAANGEVALETLGDGTRFDILVTDQGMPGMTGSQLIARVRERGLAIGTILISGWGEEGGDAAAEAYLAKPPTLESFREAIRGILDGGALSDGEGGTAESA